MWIEAQPVPGSGGRLVRREPFGGTIALRRPEMLVLVDHAWLGQEARPPTDLTPSAPFEAHLTLAHGCSAGCPGCYIDARPDADDCMGEAEWRAVLRKLASLGVFHLALGGGESLSWDRLVALAVHARELGMTPNLSTRGLHLTPAVAERLRVFGQVHVSLDGVEGDDAGGTSGFMGLRILRAYHPRVGVNCVVSRRNADRLDPLFRTVRREGVRQVELLRFKPAGRGAGIFGEMDLTPRQARGLCHLVLTLARRHRLRVRMDCSFTPMVCTAGYPPGRLMRMGVAGCVAGSWLVAVDGRGRLSGCSFASSDPPLRWQDLGRPGLLDDLPGWTDRAPEPCVSCPWLRVCRGGCHVVSRHVTGDFLAPDPGCPRVREAKGSSLLVGDEAS